MNPLPRTTLLAGALLLGGALLAPVTVANGTHGDTVHIVLEAGEAGDCPDSNYCFDVVSGDESKVTGGNTVELEIRNPSDNSIQHNAHVADTSDADRGGDTPASAAFGNTNDVSPGETDTTTFTVPDGVETTYIWCDIAGHESGGMWLEAGATGDGGDGGGGNGSPGFTALGVLAGVGLALVVAGRRD